MKKDLYDVAVIGGGPGGYSAALYCARSGYSVLVLEKLSAGGQMATTGQVDNYPGFDEGIDGFELGEKMQRGAQMRLLRDNIVIYDGAIASLQRFKDSVKEVAQGYECGITFEKFQDIKEGDVIEAYLMEQIEV